MHRDGHQQIGCTVASCAYNERGKTCALHSIVVEPCANCSSGKAEEESMCASYRAR